LALADSSVLLFSWASGIDSVKERETYQPAPQEQESAKGRKKSRRNAHFTFAGEQGFEIWSNAPELRQLLCRSESPAEPANGYVTDIAFRASRFPGNRASFPADTAVCPRVCTHPYSIDATALPRPECSSSACEIVSSQITTLFKPLLTGLQGAGATHRFALQWLCRDIIALCALLRIWNARAGSRCRKRACR
jgi:hypothetical protein